MRIGGFVCFLSALLISLGAGLVVSALVSTDKNGFLCLCGLWLGRLLFCFLSALLISLGAGLLDRLGRSGSLWLSSWLSLRLLVCFLSALLISLGTGLLNRLGRLWLSSWLSLRPLACFVAILISLGAGLVISRVLWTRVGRRLLLWSSAVLWSRVGRRLLLWSSAVLVTVLVILCTSLILILGIGSASL